MRPDGPRLCPCSATAPLGKRDGAPVQRVEWTARARKEIARLERDGQRRVLAAIDTFAAGEPADVKWLEAVDPPEYRLRAGNWRVRFSIDHASGAISILHVLRRDEAY